MNKVNRLANVSFLKQYTYNKYEFLVPCGFTIKSCQLSALKGRLTSLLFQNANMEYAYFVQYLVIYLKILARTDTLLCLSRYIM